jgi:hypothetical protein
MKREYRMVKDMIKTCPLPLLSLTGKMRQFADDFLPYDTGMEIECNTSVGTYSLNKICKEIIPEVEIDHSDYELRFRIPKGVRGLVSLYHISKILNQYCNPNPDSGNHYHVDFNDISKSSFDQLATNHSGSTSWILKALISWKYIGTYNEWMVSTWKTAVKFHSKYRTLETRIGEMTFEYELLLKRIVHCQNISGS